MKDKIEELKYKDALNDIATYSIFHNNMLDNQVEIIEEALARLEEQDKIIKILKQKFYRVMRWDKASEQWIEDGYVTMHPTYVKKGINGAAIEKVPKNEKLLTEEEFELIKKFFNMETKNEK